MAKFLAVYTGKPGPRPQPDPAMIAKGVAAWTEWGARHAGRIVEAGGPLGKTKKVDGTGIADIANEMGAFTVVRAASHEAAAKMFENHPHFAIFPGERVEIMPVLPIPGG